MDLFREAMKEYFSEKAPTSLQQQNECKHEMTKTNYMYRIWGNLTRAYSHVRI